MYSEGKRYVSYASKKQNWKMCIFFI